MLIGSKRGQCSPNGDAPPFFIHTAVLGQFIISCSLVSLLGKLPVQRKNIKAKNPEGKDNDDGDDGNDELEPQIPG